MVICAPNCIYDGRMHNCIYDRRMHNSISLTNDNQCISLWYFQGLRSVLPCETTRAHNVFGSLAWLHTLIIVSAPL